MKRTRASRRHGKNRSSSHTAGRAAAVTRVDEEWLVDKLVPGGEGLCRLPDGRPGFVRSGLPGDRLSVSRVEEHKGYRRARAFRLLERGPHRVAPECPIARSCGGCDWMELERSAELEHKRQIVAEALRRTGRIDAAVSDVVTAGETTGYRRRIRVHVAGGRFGFFRPGTHELVEVESCAVAHPALVAALSVLRPALPARSGLDAIDLRVGSDGRVVARLVGSMTAEQVETLARLAGPEGVSVVAGSPEHPLQAFDLPGGVKLTVEPGAFSQVNWEVNCSLVRALTAGAIDRRAETFLDLFAGAGNFSLPLLAAGLAGVSVERSDAASRSAKRSALEAGFDDWEYVEADAGAAAAKLVRAGRKFDLIVLDPPRSGAREVLGHVIRLGAPSIAYVSCDPVTLARDAAELVSAGYAVESVTPYDMFPRTHHVEILCWLGRRSLP